MRKLHIVSGILLTMAIASHSPVSSDYALQETFIVACSPCYEDPNVFDFDMSLLDGEHNEMKLADEAHFRAKYGVS